jgi:hypothetical protein
MPATRTRERRARKTTRTEGKRFHDALRLAYELLMSSRLSYSVVWVRETSTHVCGKLVLRGRHRSRVNAVDCCRDQHQDRAGLPDAVPALPPDLVLTAILGRRPCNGGAGYYDPVEDEHLRFIQDWIISFGRAAADRIARDADNLADLARDAGRARAAWFDEFITEAHIYTTSGSWPLPYDPQGPDELTGEHLDLRDHAAVEQWPAPLTSQITTQK